MSDTRETIPGDLVLIQSASKPAGFARIEAIRPHELEGWYHCDLLLLAVPPRPITWILERVQIDGGDFTMSGQPIRLERLPDLGASHASAEEMVEDTAEDHGEGTAGDTAEDSPEESAGNTAEAPAPGPKPGPTGGRTGKVVDLFPRE